VKTNVTVLIVLIWFCITGVLPARGIDIQWNTFLGSTTGDNGYGIVQDSSGNTTITGLSTATWGTPINAHSGGNDMFVAKLDSSGNLLWNTFLGSAVSDYGKNIVLDISGNIYVIGKSDAGWGIPVNAHSGGSDVLVVCLNGSGSLLWNTFLGSSDSDYGSGIALGSTGNVYVTGDCYATWGSPVNGFSGTNDTFVASLDCSGNMLWNTFLGSSSHDSGNDLTLDSSDNIYVTGKCGASWGSPVNTYSGSTDVFVAALNSSGTLLWNTFLGSAANDIGSDVTLDGSGNIHLVGFSNGTWGSPVNAYNGNWDTFVACLDTSGNLLWNTFLGSGGADCGYGIALDSSGNVYVTGDSYGSWGAPINAYSGENDVFMAALDDSGNLRWNTFLGSASDDYGRGIFIDNLGDIYAIGHSIASWGSPVNAHNGDNDIFVVRLSTSPTSDITANDSDGPISISESDSLLIRVSLDSFGSSANVDFWLAYKGPSGWVHYNNSTKKWETGLGVTHQGPLMDLNNKKAFKSSSLAPGNYTFYFGVDMEMDGKVTKSSLYKDEVQVTVTSN
jgi:hypothetical protein